MLNPNPFTSGGARWNVMAAYGAQLRLGKTHKQAVAYLESLYRHIPVQDKSAREALQTFLGGKGDALLAYENEALFAKQKGQDVQFVIPKETILIENPVAVVKTSKHKPEARAFIRFLRTPEAQRIYAQNGYRPVLKSVAKGVQVPGAPGPVQDRPASAVGPRSRSSSSTRARGSWPRSSGRSGRGARPPTSASLRSRNARSASFVARSSARL